MWPSARRFALVSCAVLGWAGFAHGRELSFEARVRAQEAIERVRHAHQIGVATPFEVAVPRAVIEAKVRTYLQQSALLADRWNTPITDAMLQSELERMASASRLPERLRELFAALGGDAFVIKECLARAVLADRLARRFYAFDAELHREARRSAEALRQQIDRGDLDPEADHPARSVSDPGLVPAGLGRATTEPIVEGREAFVTRVVLSEGPHGVRVASYVVPKEPWDAWWATVRTGLDVERVAVAAAVGGVVPAVAAGVAVGEPDPSCDPQDEWENGTLDDVPDPRERHTAVWTGSEMLVWGGVIGGDSGQALASGGRYDPATDAWTPITTIGAPVGRSGHTAVWTGDEMVVWGGMSGGVLATGGRYDPGADRWEPVATSAAPSGRSGHTAVWTGSEMLVWGGYDGAFLNTGGRYDPAADAWTSMPTSGAPSVRAGHTAVWTGDEMVVWGGEFEQQSLPQYLNTGARFAPASGVWTTMPIAAAPAGRSGHTAVWTGRWMVIYGGTGARGDLATTGRYDPNPSVDAWVATAGTDAPSARADHTAVWTGSEMIVWGGSTGDASNRQLLDTGGRYRPDTDLWVTTAADDAPTARRYHTAVWTGRWMLVWGGTAGELGGRELNTGARYEPASDGWTATSTGDAPSGRSRSTAVWTGNEMIVWGGFNGYFLASGARYDPAIDVWTAMSTVGAPSGRTYHSAVWTGDRMVVWGGYDGDYIGTGGRYDPIADSWSVTQSVGAPGGRAYHTAVWTGAAMVVWGGESVDAEGNLLHLDTGGRYDPATDAWTPTSTVGAAASRSFHTVVWTGTEMIVWGGDDGAGGLDTGARYDPLADAWTPVSADNAPSPRYLHTAVWTGTRMVVWGGFAGAELATGAMYDPSADAWTATSSDAAPTGRYRHTAVWTGDEMVVWGGTSANVALATGGRYDLQQDRWSTTTAVEAPQARDRHVAVWTGSAMLLWGGLTGGDYLESGGRYRISLPEDADDDGYAACDGDCNDADPYVNPGATELCNGRDDDCDGATDDGCAGLVNVSTRGFVGTGDAAMIGGFIIEGTAPQRVLVRVLGPTLGDLGVAGALVNPVLTLTASGGSVLASNDDWQAGRTAQEIADIRATGLAPPDGLEPAILITLDPGSYTAIVTGSGDGTGVALVDAFGLDPGIDARLVNVSTRGFVGVGAQQQIGGFIIEGPDPRTVLVRALGPTLGGLGVSGALANPVLSLVAGGTVVESNDDWQAGRTPEEIAAITATGLAPPDALEPAILITLPPGAYTSLVSGAGGTTGVEPTGIGIVEVYDLSALPGVARLDARREASRGAAPVLPRRVAEPGRVRRLPERSAR